MVTNIKILTTSGQQIDYINAEELGIKMNRVAIDLTKPDNRYGEFSYSFNIPMTRNNQSIMQFAGSPNVKDIFKINPIEVKVFNNDVLLLSGQLELQSIENEKYKCVLYSKLTQLVDDLQDKNMQNISCCPKIAWDYENTIKAHIATGGTNSDQTPYQFPLVFYNTYYCPTSVFTGLTDTIVDANGQTNHLFQRERDQQNWYYILNHSSIGENEFYVHQTPLAFFLKSAMQYMLQDVGWSMGGSFWEDSSIKRIIMPYIGDTDVYDRAKFCNNGGWISGGTCFTGDTFLPLTKPVVQCGSIYLNTAMFMPDYDCLSFLEDVVKLFNLYMLIDINQKTITFETYDVMFGSKIAPYNIDNKVIGENVVSRVDDYDPTVTFADIPNQRILGDNRYIASSGTSAYTQKYLILPKNNVLFDAVFNHIGTTTGTLKLGFGAPGVKRMRIRNEFDITDVNQSAGDHVLFMPMITKQLPEDNSGKNFSKKDTDSIAFNNEETIQYNGKPALFFYYGQSNSDFVQKSGKGYQRNYLYINYADTNTKIPFCSPFALTAYRGIINETLNNAYNNPQSSSGDSTTILAGYMQSIYLMMASSGSTPNPTDFSLILSDDSTFGDTIYTKFHQNKYNRFRHSEVLTMKIICNDYDWRQLQINTPIGYNRQIYSIMSINNYDVVKQQAQLILIKQL
jgi:hypothetical protein